MMKRALINELGDRMGPNLADFLPDKGYEVHGIVGRGALEDPTHRLARIMHSIDRIQLHAASLDSDVSIINVIGKVRPNECHHLAAKTLAEEKFLDKQTHNWRSQF
jgi:GDPmannose 4,6-dehydratase